MWGSLLVDRGEMAGQDAVRAPCFDDLNAAPEWLSRVYSKFRLYDI